MLKIIKLNKKKPIHAPQPQFKKLGLCSPFEFHHDYKNIVAKRSAPFLFVIVPEVGLEPTPLAGHDFESCAATNYATPASEKV